MKRQPKDITIVFDFDGVICNNNHGDYANAPPFSYAIENVNKVYDMGYHVVICTARYGQRHPGKQYQYGFEEATKWLRRYGVRYHELHMGKPAGDLYVDDKGCQIDSKLGEHTWDVLWKRLQGLHNVNVYNEVLDEEASYRALDTYTYHTNLITKLYDEVDRLRENLVTLWHEEPHIKTRLCDLLNMTQEQYAVWVENPSEFRKRYER